MISMTVSDRIATITLNRPSRRNAICSEMIVDLGAALAKADRDPGIGAVVLKGASPSFCAGSDLKELGQLDVDGMVANEADTAALARRIALLSVPVIAAVEGHALGGGFILAASCDLVVTSAEAKWSLPEVPNGWIPPWGLKALEARTGARTALRLTLGFEVLDGETALRLGVADYVAPVGETAAKALEIAAKLTALPAVAVASTKRFFAQTITGASEVWDSEAGRLFAENCAHPVAKATLERFAAKA